MSEASSETLPEEADQPVTLRLVQPPLEVEGGVLGGTEFELTGSASALAASLEAAPFRAALERMEYLFAHNLRSYASRTEGPFNPEAIHGGHLLVPMGAGKTTALLSALMREVEDAGEDPAEFIATATRAELKRRTMQRWLDEQEEPGEAITEEEKTAARAGYKRA
ncbi:hypothetical protein ACF064_01475 [Streptomyces sp. NPDC015492]|uniref:hypothetical protein n=1 Tax=Streptomyces sp. NPDC015492 TaxID=3364958 RepID=UPI0037008402